MNNANLRIVVNNEQHVPKETTAFTKEAYKISDEAFVVKTAHSGKYYHLRMRVKSEKKYFRKSLKTIHLDTALERAKLEVAKVRVNVENIKTTRIKTCVIQSHLNIHLYSAS